MAITDWVDRRFGWNRLPGPLGVLTLIGVRNRLRQRNLYDTGLRPRTPSCAHEPPTPLTARGARSTARSTISALR